MPRELDIAALRAGKVSELANLLPIEGVSLNLPSERQDANGHPGHDLPSPALQLLRLCEHELFVGAVSAERPVRALDRHYRHVTGSDNSGIGPDQAGVVLHALRATRLTPVMSSSHATTSGAFAHGKLLGWFAHCSAHSLAASC